MNQPRQIFSRIRRQKARPASPCADRRPAPAPAPVAPSDPTPTPSQASAPPKPAPAVTPGPAQARPAPAAPPAGLSTARPAGSHALYSQVMRRHDRMGTRHL